MRPVLKPRLKSLLSFRVVTAGIAFLACFTLFYLYFNLGNSKDAKAANNYMTAAQDGNWTSSSTWSLGRTPKDSDTLVIGAGRTVTIDVVTQTYVHMYIKVYGTLHFNGGKKIVMCDGKVDVYSGGALAGDNGGSKIDICNTMVWDGNDPGLGPLSFGSFGLPITLINFDATPAGSSVELNWVTANEINNDFFTIERSTDGSNFTPLKRIRGAGNSTSTLNYSASDESPFNGINYYRLRQTDYDGKNTSSKVKSVRFDKAAPDKVINIESIYSGIDEESITVNYSAQQEGSVMMSVISPTGRLVASYTWHAARGNNTCVLPRKSTLACGIYFMRLVMNDESTTMKFIKG
jgi:hypothetical protein